MLAMEEVRRGLVAYNDLNLQEQEEVEEPVEE
jgi:hypothetical protein